MEDIALGAPSAAPEPVRPPDEHVSTAEVVVPSEVAPRRSPEQAERLVLDLIAEHADSLLRVARRYSLCADDAQDAYQRTLEMLMRHAARLDADRAGGWLHTVVKREAVAVNKSRRRIVGGQDVDLDSIEVRTAPSPEDRVLGFERVARSAEALQRLKPHELRALWLKAMGNSYQEICETTGWSYTKVNRCLAEGRKSFLARYAGIEAGEECERWAPALSAMVDGEASAEQLVELRPHLRNCGACQATVRELRGSSGPLVVVFPVTGAALGGDHGPLDASSHFVARLWELVWGSVHERATTTAYRAHAVVEAMTGGKLAATAASMAAIAGGGLAVEEAVTRPPTGARSALIVSAPAPSVTHVAASRAAVRPPAAAGPVREPIAATGTSRRRAAKRRSPARRASPVPTATVARAAPAAPPPSAATPTARPAGSSAPASPGATAGAAPEFDVEQR
jgi:RNA polymerase sigma factor (sigma-70 family)